jgi:hypothetical protein
MMPLVSLLSGRQTMRWSAVSSRSSSGPRAPPQPGLVGDRAPCPGDLDALQPRQRSTDQASAPHQVKWLHYLETPATSSTLLVEAITSATLPAGRGHVYIAGEVQVVAAVQRAALAHGLEPDQVFAKAYWGRGKANADRGEPD